MLTEKEIEEYSKDPNQGFDICAVCGGVDLANTMEETHDVLVCGTCNSDVLKYQEWAAVSVATSRSQGTITIFSLQNKKQFLAKDEHTLKPILDDKNEREALLMKIYHDNYAWIQQQHQQWLKDNIDNVETNP